MPRKKPRPYHHGDLARALRTEALALLAEVGPEALTLREVARRAGVSHTAPYRHYPDKRALLTAIAVEATDLLAETLRTALAGAGPDLRSRFLAAGHAYVRFSVDHRARFRTMFLTSEIDPTSPELVKAGEECFSILLAYIADAQEAAFFAPGEPMQIAVAVWAMHQGLAALAESGSLQKIGELRAVSDASHARLLDGLLARTPPAAEPATRARRSRR
ncbi:MAG: TetR/AcrR family transcriptional regulator [Polyangiaceae bacterium]